MNVCSASDGVRAAGRGMHHVRRKGLPGLGVSVAAHWTAGKAIDKGSLLELLRRNGPQHWPFPSMSRSSARRYTDGRFPTPSGRARFWVRPHQLTGERTEEDFPLLLTIGRVVSQWRTRTDTDLVKQRNGREVAASISLDPAADGGGLSLRDAQRVRVESRRDTSITTVRIDPTVPPRGGLHADPLQRAVHARREPKRGHQRRHRPYHPAARIEGVCGPDPRGRERGLHRVRSASLR